jgi:DNA-binding beta-propeller fold protein YncE
MMNIDRRGFVLAGASALTLAATGCGGGDEASAQGLPAMESAVGASAAAGGAQFVVEPDRHLLWITGTDGVKRKAGGLGRGLGQLNYPIDVAASRDSAYVVETGNHRVQRFDATGASLGAFGEGVLLYPGGIALSPDEILVADSRNGRIAVFDLAGRLLRTFGQGLLSAPRGLALSGSDLLVADPGLRKVVRLDAAGRLVSEVSGEWVLPWDVATDGQQVFVSDAAASAIAVVGPGQKPRQVKVPKPPKSVKVRGGRLYVA